jgi:hypothetical protein
MAGIPSTAQSPNPYAASTAGPTTGQSGYLVPLSVLTTLFFMWGGLTSLNDVLIPHLKGIFSLSYFEAMLVQFCFFGAYGAMSIPAGWFVKKIGFKTGIMVGLAGAALGCLMFYPAAASRSYGLFLTAFFVLATGIVVLQVAANPFVAVLGRPETASSRLTLTQAFNSLATWAVGSRAREHDAHRTAGAGGDGRSASVRWSGRRARVAFDDRLAIEATEDRHVGRDGRSWSRERTSRSW